MLFKIKFLFGVVSILIFTRKSKCINFSEENLDLAKQSYISSSDIRGYFKVSIEITRSLTKNDIKTVLRHDDVKLSKDRHILVCLSSRRNKSVSNLSDCMIANFNSKHMKLNGNQQVVTKCDELAFPITKKNISYQVIIVKMRIRNNSADQTTDFWSNVASTLYDAGTSHDVILTSLQQKQNEKVKASLSVVCLFNFFGPQCQFSCNPPSARHRCDHVTGKLKCAKGWIGKHCDVNVFASRMQASQFIKNRSKRANSQFFEEMLQGNIERECLEEQCSREEAREAFEDEALTDAFWRAYTDPDHCNPNPCDPDHTNHCEDMVGNYSCHCQPAFTGRNCEIEIGVCHNNPCRNGGTCVGLSSTTYACLCLTGFRGRTCSINIDDCIQSNCGFNGECIDGVDSFSCRCDDGFEGQQCDQNIDECSSGPCQNGGSCIDHVAFYTCQCPPTFMGKNCHIEINPCREKPCLHGGRCKVSDSSFNCSCRASFTGKLCQHHIQSICATAPCVNGGTCYEIVNNITDELNPDYPDIPQEFGCACAVGFTGHTCEERVNQCYVEQDLCPRNATCVALDQEYICVCPEGHVGDSCQYPGDDSEALDRLRCSDNPCTNDARCLYFQNQTTCLCRPGFEGLRCEFEANYCGSHPCTNNGDCIPVPSGFYCSCPQGFRGKYCEEDIDECSLERRVCQNRGTCSNSNGSFQCLCGPYHTGRFCEHQFDPCQSDPCENGGTCDRETTGYVCDCLQGYGGRNCQRIIDPCTEITDPCLNGASCSSNPEVPTEAICSCTEGFYGRSCSNRVDNCAVRSKSTTLVNGKLIHRLEERKDCGEHGDCSSTNEGFICNCHPGFEGERCEIAFKLPIVNCTSENCHCPSELVEEVRAKSQINSQLECQYRHYTEGICSKATCLTSVCHEHNKVYECAWLSDCLTAYLASNSSERLRNSSFDCPVLEIILDRNKLEDDTTVEHFCDDVRGLQSYQRFADVALVHCSLLQINEDNCSLVVSVDSVTSKKQALLLASEVFQTLEQNLESGNEELNPNLVPTFSAIMEVRYAAASARLPTTTNFMTSAPPHTTRNDNSSTHYYIIIAILTVVILTCFRVGYVCFSRRRRKNELLVSYVVNPNSNLTHNGEPIREATNTAQLSSAASVLRRKSKKSRSNNGYANQGFAEQQQTCNTLKARLSVESNPYVMTPYSTIDGSSGSTGSRWSFDSEQAEKTVEESTIDYEMMQKIQEVQGLSHYEMMTRFSSSTEVNRVATIDNCDFTLESPSKQLLKHEETSPKRDDPLTASLSEALPNEYEEIPIKPTMINPYEMVEPNMSMPLYSNLQMQSKCEENERNLEEDAPYHFATEMPSMGVPSFLPCQKAASTSKSTDSSTEAIYASPSRGKFQKRTAPVRGANDSSQLYSNGEVVQDNCTNTSAGSPVFYTNENNSSFSEKKWELPK